MKGRPGMVWAAVLASLFTNSACQNLPGPYAPPAQRQPLADFRAYRLLSIVDMAADDAKSHFVQDITSMQTASWRWTGKRPTVRVRIAAVEHLRYTIDFAIAGATLQATGPVTVSFLVNDRVLDQVRYSQPEAVHFEKLIPEGWVTAGEDVTVGAEVDKVWTAPPPAPKLGLILVRIGLTQ